LSLEFRAVKKRWGNFSLDMDFRVEDGETLVLAGMSGCGKTTALTIIAGLVAPDEGTVLIGGRDMSGVPSWKRGVSLVFQDLALFPHLDTAGNVAYGPFIRGVPGRRRAEIVREQLEAVHLPGFGARKIATLSGGERQRAAIARALAASPRALLLDEPFSSLDAPLRRRLRREFRELLKAADFPSVFVTHDQEEAAAIADRIAFVQAGRIVESGPPEAVFLEPKTRSGAEFFGAGTVLPCSVLIPRDAVLLSPGPRTVPLPARLQSVFFEGRERSLEFAVSLPGRTGPVILRTSLSSRAPCPPEGSETTVWIAVDLLRYCADNVPAVCGVLPPG
jgi:ABC-type Fe3+/spermidine/putrescine transport system ATPase subunit